MQSRGTSMLPSSDERLLLEKDCKQERAITEVLPEQVRSPKEKMGGEST